MNLLIHSNIAAAGFHTAVVLGVGYSFAAISWFFRRLPFAWRASIFMVLSGLLFACPFLIPRPYPLVRGVVSAVMVLWWMKSWDIFHRSAAANTSFPAHLVALLSLGKRVAPAAISRPSLPLRLNRWLSAVGWGGAFFAGLAFSYWVFKADWSECSFLVEHFIKVISLLLGVGFCVGKFHSAVWRLGDVQVLIFPLNLLWSASPAEFWRRWNRPVHEWLFAHVFRPVRRVSSLAVAVVAAFFVSGILHEYVVGMACHRITGYPTAFFLVEGLGVLATARVSLRGAWRGLGIILTLAFNLVMSVWLLAPLDLALPFYDNEIPRWILLW